MSTQAGWKSTFQLDSSAPKLVTIGHAFLLPIPVSWSIWCFSKKSNGLAARRILILLGVSWAILSLNSLALLINAAVYMQCDKPYMFIRPAIKDGACPGMIAYAIADISGPVGAGLFMITNVCRFLLTIRSLCRNSTYLFLKLAALLIGLATIVKTTAVLWLLPVANQHAIDPRNLISAPEKFSANTELPFYAIVGICEISSTIVGIKFFYGILKGVPSKFRFPMDKKIRDLKQRERRLLLIATGLFFLNILLMIVYCTLFAGDILATKEAPLITQLWVYCALARIYGSVQMLAIDSTATAITCNRQALELGAKKNAPAHSFLE